MPHRLENDSELQGVIERILAIVEKSIPVASRAPLHTLPKYPDAVNILPTIEPPSTTITPEPSSAMNDGVSAAISSTDPSPTSIIESIAKEQKNSDSQIAYQPAPTNLLSQIHPPLAPKDPESDGLPSPSLLFHTPPSLSPPPHSPSPSPSLPPSLPHNTGNLFTTHVLVVSVAVAVGITIAWVLSRKRK